MLLRVRAVFDQCPSGVGRQYNSRLNDRCARAAVVDGYVGSSHRLLLLLAINSGFLSLQGDLLLLLASKLLFSL